VMPGGLLVPFSGADRKRVDNVIFISMYPS
jgi:hypothetical protein